MATLETEIARPDLWDDQDNARAVSTEYGRVGDDVKALDDLAARLEDAETLYEMAVEENDESQTPDLERQVRALARELDDLELRSLFTGEHDERDAVCEIHAGDGGTDAQDWAEMMLRMYLRWAERRGFGIEIDEVTEGQEAGILSATFIIKGRYAYGLLAAERGRAPPRAHLAVRRAGAAPDVVRVSHGHAVLREVTGEVDIDEKDLRVDTYRSSGAGGQHVNVTDSAVRITHLPTGIVVSCQNERSQMQNKAAAMQVLAAKLAERQREERQAEMDALAGRQVQVGWGSQIRSYVLAPYQLVKDLRTEYETGNVQAVLDGDLDAFMEAYLRWRRTQDG